MGDTDIPMADDVSTGVHDTINLRYTFVHGYPQKKKINTAFRGKPGTGNAFRREEREPTSWTTHCWPV